MVKRASRQMIEKYYARLTFDFHTNKRVADEVAELPSKRVRNQIAGYVSHLMKRIQRGPVRGISLKLQEEERERRMDFIPDQSFVEVDAVEIDSITNDLIQNINVDEISKVPVKIVNDVAPTRRRRQQKK
jgi:small subunit ribosomal protein S17e